VFSSKIQPEQASDGSGQEPPLHPPSF